MRPSIGTGRPTVAVPEVPALSGSGGMSQPSGIEATAAGQKQPEGSGVRAIGVDDEAVDPRRSEGREVLLGEPGMEAAARRDAPPRLRLAAADEAGP